MTPSDPDVSMVKSVCPTGLPVAVEGGGDPLPHAPSPAAIESASKATRSLGSRLRRLSAIPAKSIAIAMALMLFCHRNGRVVSADAAVVPIVMVAVPEPWSVAGLTVQVVSVLPGGTHSKFTVPPNPPTEATVRITVPL